MWKLKHDMFAMFVKDRLLWSDVPSTPSVGTRITAKAKMVIEQKWNSPTESGLEESNRKYHVWIARN